MVRRTSTVAIGIVPPPVSGKALVTRYIFDQLKVSAAANVMFIEQALAKRSWGSLGVRIKMSVSVLVCAVMIRLQGRRVPIYLVAEGGASIVFTVLYAFFLRPIASPLVIHHHGRYWLERPNPFLRACLFNKSVIQVSQCQAMSDLAHASYGNIPIHTLTNAFLVKKVKHPQISSGGIMRLAHLSNLTVEKGLGRAIATFEVMKNHGIPVALRIGGVPQDAEAERILRNAIDRHPEIEWYGYVSDDLKDDFFLGVTAFLFPTEYDMETEGIVVLEAMARSVPVIATDLCCLKDNIADSGGLAIALSRDFISEAAALLWRWHKAPDQYRIASEKTLNRFNAIRRRSLAELEVLLRHLGGARSDGYPSITFDMTP